MRGEIAEDKFPEFVVVGRAVDVGEELDPELGHPIGELLRPSLREDPFIGCATDECGRDLESSSVLSGLPGVELLVHRLRQVKVGL